MERFARQIQLKEVGLDGQDRIMSSILTLPLGISPEMRHFAELYGQRCGMSLADADAAASASPAVSHPEEMARHFKHHASRAIGVAAGLVQAQIMEALNE